MLKEKNNRKKGKLREKTDFEKDLAFTLKLIQDKEAQNKTKNTGFNINGNTKC